MVSMADPFLAILSHTPSDVAWCSSSHVAHASREANGMIDNSGLVTIASPFGARCAARPYRKFTGLAPRSQVGPRVWLCCRKLRLACESRTPRRGLLGKRRTSQNSVKKLSEKGFER